MALLWSICYLIDVYFKVVFTKKIQLALGCKLALLVEIILARKKVSEYLSVNITLHCYPDYYYQYACQT